MNIKVKNALVHAMKKNADVALIYDKYGSFHRNNIAEGIKEYESKNKHRFVAIITVNSKKEVNEWQHDK